MIVLNNFKNSHNTNIDILLAVESVQRSRSISFLTKEDQIFISMPYVLISKKESERAELPKIARNTIST